MKREKIKKAQARRRSTERQVTEGLQRATADRLTERQRAVEVVELKYQRSEGQPSSGLRTAKVSLVQRQ